PLAQRPGGGGRAGAGAAGGAGPAAGGLPPRAAAALPAGTVLRRDRPAAGPDAERGPQAVGAGPATAAARNRRTPVSDPAVADPPPPAPQGPFADRLAAADDALAAGLPTEAGPLWQRDLAFAQRVRRLLRPPAPDGAGPAPEVPPGSVLGRFRVVRELGRGGCGIVFLAEDPLLARAVALKLPRAELLTSPGGRERFLREARAAAGLDHPNIVPVFEAG